MPEGELITKTYKTICRCIHILLRYRDSVPTDKVFIELKRRAIIVGSQFKCAPAVLADAY